MSDNASMTDSVLNVALGIPNSTTGCTDELNKAELEVKLDIMNSNIFAGLVFNFITTYTQTRFVLVAILMIFLQLFTRSLLNISVYVKLSHGT